jgi:protein SCO1/2
MMHPNQKILVTTLWGLAVLAMVALIGTGLWARRQSANRTADPLASDLDQHLGVIQVAPPFSLTDQNGRTVTDADLRGNVWVAMVFFSECPGVCPMMAQRMLEIQKAVDRSDVKVVSFSIDPEHDTPEVLDEYAERLDADESRWFFLTGEKSTMFALAKSYQLAAAPAQEGQPITHTQKVLLIDRENQVRAFYDTNDDQDMKQLAIDIRSLVSGRPS